jgi:hypothetical protein
MVVGSLDSGRTVAISENGSLAKAQGPVEFRDRLGDFGGGEYVEAVEPCLGRISVEVRQTDGGCGRLLLLLILWGHGWLIVVGCA